MPPKTKDLWCTTTTLLFTVSVWNVSSTAMAASQRANNNKVQFENYGYNWPYDNFSLIELLKIESEIGYD